MFQLNMLIGHIRDEVSDYRMNYQHTFSRYLEYAGIFRQFYFKENKFCPLLCFKNFICHIVSHPFGPLSIGAVSLSLQAKFITDYLTT